MHGGFFSAVSGVALREKARASIIETNLIVEI